MDPAIKVLMWWLLFAGTHTLLSHPPIRDQLVARLGYRLFALYYSIVAFVTFIPLVWTFFHYRNPDAERLPALVTTPGIAWLVTLMMLIALLLIVLGISRPNPVSALTGGSNSSAKGVLRITRHPGFMGLAIFGLAHLLVTNSAIDCVFFGGMFLYALAGAARQDWRRRLTASPELLRFYAETSFFPFAAIATRRNRFAPGEFNLGALIAATALFFLIFEFHDRLFG